MVRVSHHSVDDSELEAVIFDVDGTLVDTMPHYYKSWVQTCEEYKLEFSELQFYGYAGRTLPDIIHDLITDQHKTKPTSELINEFLKKKLDNHAKVVEKHGHPKAIECVAKIAHEMKKRGIKVGAASSGQRENVIESLKVNNLLHLFDEDHIVVGADLPKGRGKPEPDIFLEAARRLNVCPTKCRAFEDGESGLQSAFKAGMEVIDVRELEGYPLAEALQKHLPTFKGTRHWLTPPQ